MCHATRSFAQLRADALDFVEPSNDPQAEIGLSLEVDLALPTVPFRWAGSHR